LSDTAARGQIWCDRHGRDHPIDDFVQVGASLIKWRPT
jgi:hypothetical protein